ncbi:MAG: thiamine phosphate synthase [Deltaproteobacteria bacterium]|jgi:thiamine-phosphate pyrophosphorylase|nr:thiamine phosphate synthase [Deltaproteobacteria bacterium]
MNSPSQLLERSRLTLVIGQTQAKPRTILELADLAFKGGVTALQLREKDLLAGDFYHLALELALFCRQKDKLFIVNDRLDIALATGADGLHLGQDDLPLEVARRYWPRPRILGATAKTAQQAQKALDQGADYLGVGALFPSPSKPSSPVIKPETILEIQKISRAKPKAPIPLIGIGGVSIDNAALAWSWGFDGLAVISGLAQAADPTEAARQLARRPG